ncbi:hypothetical protein C1646_772356 [Rhizophagus diaphanus]|nr:hypothetical protein C1646_772356 [Rhizophagus diaphanus] [Rhizophagus sp. MUCL 43196]
MTEKKITLDENNSHSKTLDKISVWLTQLPHSIKSDIWRRLTTRKYPLTVEEASSIHPVVEELLNREVTNYLKKKDRQRLKTTANTTPGGNDTLNRLVLFEQSLSEREKEMTDRESLLRQREEEHTKKLEHAKLEIQKTITNKIKMENEAYLSAESKRLQDEHDRFVDELRSLKKKLEEQYNNQIQRIASREAAMSKSIEEKDKKIAFSKGLIQETKKTLTSAEKSINMLENKNQILEDIISAKEEKILSLYDLFTSFVPSQANDSTIEPKKYTTTYERDRWYNLRKDIEFDPEIRKKYTFRRKNEIQEHLFEGPDRRGIWAN